MKKRQVGQNKPLSADRLLSAADAILWAASAPGTGSVQFPPGPLAATMLGFSTQELEEAAIFLARLGLVELIWRAGPSKESH